MKLSTIVIIFLMLLPTATATVTREFIWNGNTYLQSFSIPYDSIDRNVTITLTPSPFLDYDIPGYYITESLPSGITLYNTNADWSDLTDRTLSLLKFMPPADKPSITYTIRLDKEKRYDFFGIYKDENKVTGEIQTQTISIESKPLINFSNVWEPSKKDDPPITVMSNISETKIIPISAYQKSQVVDDITIPIIIILFIVSIVLGVLVYKKHYANEPSSVVQAPRIDEFAKINSSIKSIGRLMKISPTKEEQYHQQKSQEVFEIIGDDDDEVSDADILNDLEQQLRQHKQQTIRLLMQIRNMSTDKFKATKDVTIRQQVMNKILEIDREIGELQRKL